jgi:hypothetical protein
MRGLPPLAPGSAGAYGAAASAAHASSAHLDRLASGEVRAVQALSGLLGDGSMADVYGSQPMVSSGQYSQMHTLNLGLRAPVSMANPSGFPGGLARLASGEVRAVQALSGLQAPGDGQYGACAGQDGGWASAAAPGGRPNSSSPGSFSAAAAHGMLGGGAGQQAMDEATEAALLARVLGLNGGTSSGLSGSTAAGAYSTDLQHPGSGRAGGGSDPASGLSTDDVHQVLQSLFGEEIARELANAPAGGLPAISEVAADSAGVLVPAAATTVADAHGGAGGGSPLPEDELEVSTDLNAEDEGVVAEVVAEAETKASVEGAVRALEAPELVA